MDKPEILFIAHRIPYPPDKGDKIRSWRLLQHLTRRYRVHLACFVDDKRDFTHTDFLRGMCESAVFIPLNPTLARLKSMRALGTDKPMSFAYYADPRMSAAVIKMRARPLAAEIAFSSTMAAYLEPSIDARPRIIDFCDADSAKFSQYAREAARGPMAWVYAREGRTLARAETEIANDADASFAVTRQEAAIFNERDGATRPVDWFSNGVDTGYFHPAFCQKDEPKKNDLIFVGAMDYRANVDGVLHFVKNVWPHIRAARANVRFAIVGANPLTEIKALNGVNGITVTGRVDDVRPWLISARLAIAPLRVARGVQNKVLEAMAMAKPLIASAEAMTGINAPESAAITAADDNAMTEGILSLLNDPARAENLGRNAREFVSAHHDWDAALSRFDDALTRLGV